jgi:hypothetical protein
MKIIGRQEADVLVHFKSYVRVTPDILQLFAKGVRMHVYYSIMMDEVHWDDLWISVCIQGGYSSNRLPVEKLYHFVL